MKPITRFPIAVLAALLMAAALPPRVRAGTPSMLPGMPPEVKSLRDRILTGEEYGKLIRLWDGYIAKHPASAVAYVQKARAMRYEGSASLEERAKLIEKAYEIDPDCPEALAAMADRFSYNAGDEERFASFRKAEKLALRAVRLAPDWPYPHFTLWSITLPQGRIADAERHLGALIDKGGIPAPLLDFGYNMLQSARPGAIIFTNGDNDTYPPEAIRARFGIREDVSIVNLSLLNYPSYAVEALVRRFDGDGPVTEKEIRRWKKEWNSGTKERTFGIFLMKKVVDRAVEGAWKKPVYFAVTVAPEPLEYASSNRELEGILWRVIPGDRPAEGEEEIGIDAARTMRLYHNRFRMESATDFSFPWGARSAVRRLMSNYPAVLWMAANEFGRIGDEDGMRDAYREAIRMLRFEGDGDRAKAYAKAWGAADPKNPEPGQLIDKELR